MTATELRAIAARIMELNAPWEADMTPMDEDEQTECIGLAITLASHIAIETTTITLEVPSA